jgi:hypothetical protein
MFYPLPIFYILSSEVEIWSTDDWLRVSDDSVEVNNLLLLKLAPKIWNTNYTLL